jgi:hypothetical protein
VQIVSDELDENIWKLLIDPADGQSIPPGVFKRWPPPLWDRLETCPTKEADASPV